MVWASVPANTAISCVLLMLAAIALSRGPWSYATPWLVGFSFFMWALIQLVGLFR